MGDAGNNGQHDPVRLAIAIAVIRLRPEGLLLAEYVDILQKRFAKENPQQEKAAVLSEPMMLFKMNEVIGIRACQEGYNTRGIDYEYTLDMLSSPKEGLNYWNELMDGFAMLASALGNQALSEKTSVLIAAKQCLETYTQILKSKLHLSSHQKRALWGSILDFHYTFCKYAMHHNRTAPANVGEVQTQLDTLVLVLDAQTQLLVLGDDLAFQKAVSYLAENLVNALHLLTKEDTESIYGGLAPHQFDNLHIVLAYLLKLKRATQAHGDRSKARIMSETLQRVKHGATGSEENQYYVYKMRIFHHFPLLFQILDKAL